MYSHRARSVGLVPFVLALPFVFLSCAVVPSVASPTATARSGAVPFEDVARTTNATYDGGPAIIVGTTDVSESAIVRSVPGVARRPGRVLLVAMQGSQPTAGYAIRIDTLERDGDRLLVHATFIAPAPGAITAQILTAPAHVIAIAPTALTGLHTAVLLDGAGVERSRVTLP